ncbi:regulator of G-protein signaling 6-like [Trematomus bernacchii]|uniref:regulator of G-protein signaling 6-like n=1 Tax=Trematomus bernacchii TaxID=40690 RepID=UPI00146C23AB|nr:regulator of G-protein signaling 6-like [Trematomus bernacchii]XP_033991439.1 regulator of G-protein signaling 6-like [Trematomus bernacchii]
MIYRSPGKHVTHVSLSLPASSLSISDHIYKLMKSDSYTCFLRSNVYQDLLMAKKKPETEQGRRTSLEKFTRSVGKSLTGKRLTGLMQSS